MASHAETRSPKFVSLGMIVVDELRCPGREPLLDIPGGSGAFATFGARLVAGHSRSSEIGCLVLAGHDFPQSVLQQLEAWIIDLCVTTKPNQKSTRGLLEYHDAAFSRKTFRYTTAPLQPVPEDLPPHFRSSAAYHILSGPAYIEDNAGKLTKHNSPAAHGNGNPLLVWEPLPIQVSLDARDAHMAACRLVDVFSPNHLELMTLFQGPISEADAEDARFDRKLIEEYASVFLHAGIGRNGTGSIVVRSGSRGCLVASLQLKGVFRWLPAFSFPGKLPRSVVDATGAGNTFLGGLTFLLGDGTDVVEAAKSATVAASFALQQIGLAKLDTDTDVRVESWNNETFEGRLKEYLASI